MTESYAVDREEQVVKFSAARGGPIYYTNTVGPLVRPLNFESNFLLELQNLELELPKDSSQVCNQEDILVDDLKVFTEDELVDLAVKEALKDQEGGACKQLSHEHSNGRQDDLQRSSSEHRCIEDTRGFGDISVPLELSSGSHNRAGCNENASALSSKKRQGERKGLPLAMKRPANRKKKEAVDESYLARADELVKVKNKQDQDRATARLHSLSWQMHEGTLPSSERIERMKSPLFADSVSKVKSSELHEQIMVRLPDVILLVEVHDNIRKGVKSQELLVLGCQLLTEMRDKIHCLTDQIMKKAEQHDPSGFFLIEDVFYNDLRSSSAVDYSEPIINWLTNSKDDAFRKWESIISGGLKKKQKEVVGEVTTPQLPQFRRAVMHKTRLCDLSFRLGAGYLYCHQGDCKHTIVVRDMRMIHPEDVQIRTAYPMVLTHKTRVQKCNVCGIYLATKVTVDDKWACDNPCYFCNDCYFLLHHSKDGSLLYSDFSVYDYMHD